MLAGQVNESQSERNEENNSIYVLTCTGLLYTKLTRMYRIYDRIPAPDPLVG